MLVNISFQLDTDIPEDVAKLRKIVGLETAPEPKETFPEPAPKVAKKAPTRAAEEVFPAVQTPALIPAEPSSAPTAAELREQAVHKATELVTTGQSQKVRDVLGGLGAKRVSDLKDDQLEGFLTAIA